ncbi:sulfatase-like hydrolase/transferase [Candidatus Microgenomates bacterium]|nr:sulfatase-like hydrolase/transferase [Candidatus Microgenomates bacterium]
MPKNSSQKVIFIIADTLRAKSIGIYNGESNTPNIDRLGKLSAVFTNCYAGITKTDPSISSIMSGRFPLSLGLVNHAHKITENDLEVLKNTPLLPEILKKHGFKTAAVDWMARWHRRGYDYYSGKIISDTKENVINLSSLRLFLTRLDKINVRLFRRSLLNRLYYALPQKPVIPYDSADIVVNKAIQIIKANKNRENLFLYLHLWDAHAPHTRPKGIVSYLLDDVKKTYDSEIRFLDEQIGKLINYMEETNQIKNSMIIFTADHGESLYEHNIPLAHRGLYQEVVRVPLFIKHHKLQPKRVDSLIQHVDIFPTILSLLKVPIPKNIDGKNLVPIITGKEKKVRDFAFFEDITDRKIYKNIRRKGIISKGYKYIQTLEAKRGFLHKPTPREDSPIIKEELYNTLRDPEERNNIYKTSKSIAKTLKDTLNSQTLALNMIRLRNYPKLTSKIQKSIRVIKKSADKFRGERVAVAWTGGKDSTVLLHLVKTAFGGKVPFYVLFNDSTMEFDEIYEFINKTARLWNIKVITVKHSAKELKEFHSTRDREKKKELSRLMKITAINRALAKHKFKAFIAGIRWDEHKSRSREKYFSPRINHTRVHPILHFTEDDIWEYINFFGVPYVELYDKGYRSLGEKPFTKPVPPGGNEREGREHDKEQLMQRLRKLGYW